MLCWDEHGEREEEMKEDKHRKRWRDGRGSIGLFAEGKEAWTERVWGVEGERDRQSERER